MGKRLPRLRQSALWHLRFPDPFAATLPRSPPPLPSSHPFGPFEGAARVAGARGNPCAGYLTGQAQKWQGPGNYNGWRKKMAPRYGWLVGRPAESATVSLPLSPATFKHVYQGTPMINRGYHGRNLDCRFQIGRIRLDGGIRNEAAIRCIRLLPINKCIGKRTHRRSHETSEGRLAISATRHHRASISVRINISRVASLLKNAWFFVIPSNGWEKNVPLVSTSPNHRFVGRMPDWSWSSKGSCGITFVDPCPRCNRNEETKPSSRYH